MTGKTVAQKARVKPGTTIAVVNRMQGVVESLSLPEDVAFVPPAKAKPESAIWVTTPGPRSGYGRHGRA